MSFKKSLVLWLAAASLTLPGSAQTPAPAPPKARGHSVMTRSMSKRGWLGVGLGDLTPERAKTLKLGDNTGVEVTHVEENSPASKAGLRENDVILEVNSRKVEDGEQFARTIGGTAAGTKVNLAIWRNGARRTIEATLEARPAQYFTFNGPGGAWVAPMPPEPPMGWDAPFPVLPGQSPRVGFEGETLTPQLAAYFGVKEGVLVRTVTSRTPAEKAGLKAGDVITKVSGTPVSSPREISGLVRASRTVTFTVMRDHKEITLNVEIAGERFPSPDREVL
jgi:serine protease Do